ncbi:hypothetical protein [Caldimonas tepidiphila]|uniref:hypothetical protein n=1 Tax=Caldimonas tepidiphila TaxID=2315841 RepID=UPI000E5B865B|nr:hypothetical protein [Caldimonas tepidiphila]
MSFLDDLKRQAEALQNRQQNDAASFERNAQLVESACRTVFQYWLDLAQQLNVLAPASPGRHVLDSRHVFSALPMHDFRVDARRQPLRGLEVHEHITLSCRIGDGRDLVLKKDMPPEIEKLEARLRLAGIKHSPESVREPGSGRYLHTRYEFKLDFLAFARLLPQHERGTLRIQVDNFDGFEGLVLELPAIELNRAVLDELAKLLLGQPNRFVQCGRLVGRR